MPTSPAHHAAPPGRVLVVDDAPDIRATVADILGWEGYAVETAADGAQALDAVERLAPAVVLLDVRMPVLDGWGFAAALRNRGLAVPILVMTAAPSARRWAAEIDADGYVPKPFDLDRLLAAVATVIGPPDGAVTRP
jgi:CheY-like chemotaxis protein